MKRIVPTELKDFTAYLKRKYNIFEGTNISFDNFSQVQIVMYLGNNLDKDISQKDIEEHLCFAKSSISSLLDSLENKGIIKRVPSSKDARKNNIILTDITLNSIKQIKNNLMKANKEITNGIDEYKLNIFFEVLDSMKENLRKDDHSA